MKEEEEEEKEEEEERFGRDAFRHRYTYSILLGR